MISHILRCGRLFLQPQFVDFSISATSGILISAWLHQTVTLVGTSLLATTPLILVVVLSLSAGLFSALRLASTSTPAKLIRLPIFIPMTVLAISGVFSSQLVSLQDWLLTSLAPHGIWPGGKHRFLLFLLAASPLTVPIAAAVCAAVTPVRRTEGAAPGLSAKSISGLVVGIMVASFGLLPIIGAAMTSIAAAICILPLTAAVWRLASSEQPSQPGPAEQTTPTAQITTPIPHRLRPAVLAVMYGAAFAGVLRILDQLSLDAAWITAAEYGSLLVGTVIGLWLAPRWKSAQTAPLWTSVWLALTVTAFPIGILTSLEISAYVSSVVAVAFCRTGLIAVAVVPVGIATALSSSQAGLGVRSLSTRTIVWFAVGFVATRWMAVSFGGPVPILVALAWALVAVGVMPLLQKLRTREFNHQRATIVATSFAIVAGLAAPFWMTQYTPDRSARLLFDTGVFLARRVEARAEMLEHLDDLRCLEIFESRDSTLSLWRTRGSQIQLRRSGLPHSTISIRPATAPQPSAEALQTVLPLLLHDRPQSLLVVGLGVGTTLQTALQFPVTRITCTEADSALIDLVTEKVFSRLSPGPLDDERVSLVPCEPVLAVASARDCDIIICSTSHFSQPGSAPEVTAEFLARAAHGLNEGGMFCQQFRYVDFGADSVRTVIATWDAVFEHVAAIETAPGEWLMIGTQSEAGLFRQGLVERLQRPHIRHALSHIGFDWATPLQLSVLEGQAFKQYFSEFSNGKVADPVQTVAAASMLSAGPWDVMQWGPKYAQVQSMIAPAVRTLANAFPLETADANVQRRLGELALRRDLIHKAVDSYWAYRGELKKKLKESPRAEIVQVSGVQQTRLHPEEQRRVDYFKSLGQAASLAVTTHDSLLSVEKFAAPYDPFVSFFMHQEIAELAARNPEENAALEFAHRLYRVNYTSARDGSTRNLIAAIHLLCDHDDLIPDPAERGDQLDAFLQILHQRWQNRGDVRPQSTQVALNDIEKSLAAGERAFDVLAELGMARGKTPHQVKLRKQVLEKSLMRPLRSYRTRLLKRQDITSALRAR